MLVAVISCSTPPPQIAIIGAGLAGATCARTLAQAGAVVSVFDKSRGPGGRLATRRLTWLDANGQARTAPVDHGAPGFAVRSAAFAQWLQQAPAAGTVHPWTPRLAPGSRPRDEAGPLWLPGPEMPALCRALVQGLPARWSCSVDGLQPGPQGWQLSADGVGLPGHFDAVVLAVPPAQAAPLLAEHRRDWAQRASLALMQPCWTLMGVAERSPPDEALWDLGRPEAGPLAWVMRHDARPQRSAAADDSHWVVHAQAGWSRRHLEQPAPWVQAELQAALDGWLGRAVAWRHAVVHRWRYAMPVVTGETPSEPCWWDSARGLGVCGDALGGGGVEAAWQSAQALASAVLASCPARLTPSPVAHHPVQP